MYSNFDFIFYPFLLIDIDYLIMYSLCSFFRAKRYSAIVLYRLGGAERAYQLFLSLWQGAACLSYPNYTQTIIAQLALCARGKAKYMPLLVSLQRPIFTGQVGFTKT
jgi:hypothetical protein